MSAGKRIVLGEDDFRDDPPRREAPPQAALPPVTRSAPLNVGQTPSQPFGGTYAGSTNPLNNPLAAALVAAAVGMFVAWGIGELLGLPGLPLHAQSKTGVDAYIGVWTLTLEIVFVAFLVGFEHAVAGAWAEAFSRAARAAAPAAAVGFISGFVAQDMYFRLLQGHEFDPSPTRAYVARAIGWGIFGTGAGLMLGVSSRSRRRAVNGAIGGLVGGVLGGLLFEYSADHLHTGVKTSRLIGLMAIAVLVALATRVVEAARRDAWLRVVAGGMSGKEFILYHSVTRVGSAPECEIYLLKDPGIEPLHAQIEERGSQRHLSASPAAPVLVNNESKSSHLLRNGDMIQIGKTVIAYSERAQASAPHYG